jgi:diguanylate cyclase (GGDEF)-like protein
VLPTEEEVVNSPGAGTRGGDAGHRAWWAEVVERCLGGDLEVVGELGRGARTAVLHVRHAGGDYSLKVLRRPAIGQEAQATTFHREAALLARVDDPGVPRVYDVGVIGGHPYMLLEFIAGVPLSRRLENGALDESTVLRLAADVSAALAAAHRAGLVHRDIKPANIVVTPEGQARLIDFGLAAVEGGAAGEVAPVVGTFEYSAPEQTGALARPVDGRADIYALGVVLFQCATGRLPFIADEAGELIALHARAPVPDPRASRSDLSPAFAELIVGMLAKDPDDRHRTADELLAGLRYVVGLPPRRPGHRTLLVGRNEQRAELTSRWKRAAAGTGGVVLVVGAAGVGKSSLARSVADSALDGGALVLSGKCDADSPLPLAPLRHAVDGYLRTMVALPDEKRAAAIAGLRSAAGPGAGLLRPLSGALSTLLGARHVAVEGRPEQFASAVASFLVGLAGQSGGLVLVLDDVQWLDAASLGVLRKLQEDLPTTPLLVVATARDDPAAADAVAEFSAAVDARLDLRLRVAPLDEAGTAALVSSYLAGSVVSPELTGEMAARGRGNPFTVLEYLRALIDGGALRPSWGVWRLDPERLRAIELPTDVLDLVLARIDGLGVDTHRHLQIAAALGARFETGLLARVSGKDPAVALSDATRRGLLQRGVDDDGTFEFFHDRIREALLSTMDATELGELHQRIAEVLDRGAGHGGDRADRAEPARVYAVASHFAAGNPTKAPGRVFSTCWAAGQLALDEAAPGAALSFLETAEAARELAGLMPDSRFLEALGTAYWLNGRLAEAVTRLDAGLAAEADPLRRGALLLQLSNVYRTGWELTRSIEAVRQGAAELGYPMPPNAFRLVLSTAGAMIRWLVAGARPPSTRPATGDEHARLRIYTLLCRAGSAAAALNLQHLPMVAFNLRGGRAAHRLGPTGEYVAVQGGLGAIAGSMRLHRRRTAIFDRAFTIATALGDPKAYADVAWMEAFSRVLGKKATIDDWARVSDQHRRWLDLDYYTNIMLMRCRDLVESGYAREALALHDHGRSRIADATAETFPGFAVLAGMAAALLGRPPHTRPEPAPRVAGVLDPGYGVQFALGDVQAALENDELGVEFDEAVAGFRRLGLPPAALFAEYRMIFAFEAFGRLTRCLRASGAERDTRSREAEDSVRRLGKVANEPLLRGYHRVAQASLRQLRGDHEGALGRLAEAEDVLVRLDAPLVHFEASRVRARALNGLGLTDLADRHADAALALAVRHGWAGRAGWVRAEFGVAQAPSGRGRGDLTGDSGGDRYRRSLQALQQVSEAAAMVLDPQQVARVALDELLRFVGAERGALFLVGEDGVLAVRLVRDAAGQDLGELVGYSSTLVERVAVERKSLVVTGGEEGAALGSQSAVVYGLRSIMISPLELDGRLLGVVYLDSRVARGIFTNDDVAILAAVTGHVAAALQTARAAQLELAVQAARQQRDIAETLRTAMAELAGTLDPSEVLDRLRGVVLRTVPADRVHLVMADGHKLGTEGGVVTDGALVAPADFLSLAEGRGGAGVPWAVTAVLGDVRCWTAISLASQTGGDGALVAGSTTLERFAEEDLDLLSALAVQGVLAYEKALLFTQVQELATTDGLTGLHNRRHFTDLATRQVSAARRYHRPLTVMMIDVDRFKRINDTYGHVAGDEVLRAVADVLGSTVRDEDVLGRYGGEEFCLVLPEMDGDPVRAAERLRTAVADAVVPARIGSIRVTVSIGIAEFKPDDTLNDLLSRADHGLYRAKSEGRNRVAVA